MQGARRGPWWVPRASRATPQTPLSLPTLRDRADFPSCGVVASLLGTYPTSSAPPCLRGNLPRSRPRRILRQAPNLEHQSLSIRALSIVEPFRTNALSSARNLPHIPRILRHGTQDSIDRRRRSCVHAPPGGARRPATRRGP